MPTSAFHLTVTSPFGGYSRGDEITDAATVAAILAGESAAFVVKRPAPPDAPAVLMRDIPQTETGA